VPDAGIAGAADENKGSGHTGAPESAGQGDAVPDAGAADENKGSGHTGAPESAGQGDAVPDVGTAGAADENKGAGQTGAPETDGEDKTKAAGSGTDDGKTAPAPNAEAKQPQQKKDADGAARKPDPKNAVTAARAYMEGDVIHMRILASSPIASTVFSLKTPPRVVIDLDKPRTVSGVRNDAASEVKSIRYAEHGGKTRIVLDLVKAPGKVSRRNIERNIIEVTIQP
ncbi:MAG: AMIN domain-containing protein, partial [Mailhella sp.]|nr:AMIN domain-containing protein [Mailhella sp.]